MVLRDGWPEESREAAQLVIDTYGQPDEADGLGADLIRARVLEADHLRAKVVEITAGRRQLADAPSAGPPNRPKVKNNSICVTRTPRRPGAGGGGV
jgi:hypothetical protein